MKLTFLGTGGAWRVPELNCDCLICREMRRRKESRQRTAFLLSQRSNLLIDCGPDIASQLARHPVGSLDGVLITHEHGDHYMGLDEIFSYKRACPRDEFRPVPVYLTSGSWRVISDRFRYLEEMGVITVHYVEKKKALDLGDFRVTPFKTNHGSFAAGSVGYIIEAEGHDDGSVTRLVYTSDFVDIPESVPELLKPDYLIIQSFWLNEPIVNRPNHMSFQRALGFIESWQPKEETFLVHIGDGDLIPGDPANRMLKKTKPADPLRPLAGGEPYSVPKNQTEWQQVVDEIISDRGMPYKVTVAYDGLEVMI
ncbi:MBL fold metallo-hydrolase [Thermodesulfobacteriota bacterium]